MRKSLDEIRQIEQYILGNLSPQDKASFKTRLILENDLQEKFQLQKEVYRVIQWFSRKQLKQELKEIDKKLFQTPKYKKFQEEILNIFS